MIIFRLLIFNERWAKKKKTLLTIIVRKLMEVGFICYVIIVVLISGGGGVTRMKNHLAGSHNNVSKCLLCPDDVRMLFVKELV